MQGKKCVSSTNKNVYSSLKIKMRFSHVTSGLEARDVEAEAEAKARGVEAKAEAEATGDEAEFEAEFFKAIILLLMWAI
jgi:hypothetical protein